jgi:hypothetical protein
MSHRRDRPPASPAMRLKTYAMRLTALWLTMTCLGCGDSKSPVQVTPVRPAPGPVSVNGQVNDTALRPVAGVRVEVVDGPSAGVFGTTNTAGHYELPGVFSEPLTVRATKEGYAPFTTTRSMQYGPVESICIVLALSTPSVNIAGDYTLTLTADTACSGLPDAARSRTYTVSMTSMPNTPDNYRAVLSGATFLSSETGQFLVDVAGTYAHFRFGDPWGEGDGSRGDGSYIEEEVAPSTYLGIAGSAGLTVNGGTTISGSFSGGVQYCVNPNPAAIVNYQCPVGQPVVCYSTNHRMLLVRR